MFFMGVDVGSMTTKLVVIDELQKIRFHELRLTQGSGSADADALFMNACSVLNITSQTNPFCIACGYGRSQVPFADKTVTEITCHAVGARYYFPAAACVIDIGGEDTKVLWLDPAGHVDDFVMNNKCAAGTGRFIEAIAQRLGCTLDEFIQQALSSTDPCPITHTCTVFAESEVVSLRADGRKISDISCGIHYAITERILTLAQNKKYVSEIVITGGVARNAVITALLRELAGVSVVVPPEPQFIGALGAALLASTKVIRDQ